MVTFDKSIVIRATPHAVWRAIALAADDPGWCPGLARVTVRRPLAPGELVLLDREDLGLALTSTLEVVAADAPRRLVVRQRDGDFDRFDAAVDVASTAGGSASALRVRARVDLPFVLPRFVLDADVRAHYSRVLDAALLNLKDRVERVTGGARVTGAPARTVAAGPAPVAAAFASPSRDAARAGSSY